MPKLRTALAMSGPDRLALLEASAFLAWARILVLVVPLRYWRRQMAPALARPGSEEKRPAREREEALRVSRAIRRAVRNLPVELICLPQALAARWMLRRRGIDSALYLGTRRGGGDAREFHAWLKSHGHWITGHCRESDYALFAPTGE